MQNLDVPHPLQGQMQSWRKTDPIELGMPGPITDFHVQAKVGAVVIMASSQPCDGHRHEIFGKVSVRRPGVLIAEKNSLGGEARP